METKMTRALRLKMWLWPKREKNYSDELKLILSCLSAADETLPGIKRNRIDRCIEKSLSVEERIIALAALRDYEKRIELGELTKVLCMTNDDLKLAEHKHDTGIKVPAFAPFAATPVYSTFDQGHIADALRLTIEKEVLQAYLDAQQVRIEGRSS